MELWKVMKCNARGPFPKVRCKVPGKFLYRRGHRRIQHLPWFDWKKRVFQILKWIRLNPKDTLTAAERKGKKERERTIALVTLHYGGCVQTMEYYCTQDVATCTRSASLSQSMYLYLSTQAST